MRMWKANFTNVTMTRDDYGVELPFRIKNVTFGIGDQLQMRISKNGTVILELTFSTIIDNTIYLVLTQEQSSMLPVGRYVYSLDWYKDGVFMDNLIQNARFIVEDKV